MSRSEHSLPPNFHTTQWSMILSAAEESGEALERLCRTYWRPLYGYARRSGSSSHDAEDAVQSFLARILEKQWLRTVKRDCGSFRCYLLTSFRFFLTDEHRRTTRQKRGGHAHRIPLDVPEAEAFFAKELAAADTPETAYERAWALEVFARARRTLREECVEAGRGEAHDALESGESHAVLGPRFGMSVGAWTSFSFRVRRRLQELIRAEILQTVNSQAELEDEVAAMLRALSASR